MTTTELLVEFTELLNAEWPVTYRSEAFRNRHRDDPEFYELSKVVMNLKRALKRARKSEDQ